ncbi:MAG TPA: hypothetical protein VJ783_28880 [Pirellulales bacterium]|nr:hypothetical protein [Pirellulales bacterium]
MSSSPVSLQPGEVVPSRFWRTCASLAAVVAVAAVLAIANLGFVRVSRERFYAFEWQNGWPWVFVGRHAGFDVTRGDRDAWIPDPTQGVLWFRPAAAIADASLGLALLAATCWAMRRRLRSPRPFQYGMRGLLLAVAAVSALLGWALYQHRRQQRVIDSAADLYFGFFVDQGIPHTLRRFLPGDRFRVFDRITLATVGGPKCVGDRLQPLADLHDVAMLQIGSNQLDDPALQHIRGLRRLVYLDIDASPNCVTDAGLRYIGELTELRDFRLARSEITDAGLAHLASLKRLEHLRLIFDKTSDQRISDAGLTQLRGLKALKTLDLMCANITDAGLDEIAGLTNLEYLGLAETSVTDGGLAKLSNLKSLKLLDVRNTGVTKQGLARFKLAHPGCRWLH